MLPSFIIIGSAKSGTTSLADLLDHHPEVFMCKPKEPNFFSDDRNYNRGMAYYRSLFDQGHGKKLAGEASVTYTMASLHPTPPSRIAKHLPNIKLIYMARHPLARLESHWMQWRACGWKIDPSFNKAVRDDPHMLSVSKYWHQISAYRQYFSDDQILVLFLEDFKADADATVQRCLDFIAADPTIKIPDASTPRNVWQGKVHDRAALDVARRMPLFDQARDILPMGVRKSLRQIFKKPIETRPTWDPAVRRWAVQQLENDTKQFLEFYGKPDAFWPLHTDP